MIDPADVQNEARDILSRREFQDPEPSIASRVLGWIGDRISDLFEDLFGGLAFGDTSSIANLLMFVAVAFLAYVLIKAVGRRTRAIREARVEVETTILDRRSVAEWLELAAECERDGDYDGAVRAHYRAGTTRLADVGRLVEVPGVTSGRVARDVKSSGEVERAALADMTAAFDDVWYGGRGADSAVTRQVADDSSKVGAS